MSDEQSKSIRLSQNQIRSNPLLHSERAIRPGSSPREKERRQLECLIRLQEQGVPIFRKPDFIRVVASDLKLSKQRIGVVGLAVDNSGLGYVTRLNVQKSPNPEWEVPIDLPFRPIHIKSLLLRLVGDQRIDGGLPELLAFKITDTYAERIEGDSMDVAALLAVVDFLNGSANKFFSAAAAVVSPIRDDRLESSRSITAKLQAFIREFGDQGSLLIRHSEDSEAAAFDGEFDDVWSVRTTHDLRDHLRKHELFQPLVNDVSLKAEHGNAITAWTHTLLQDEGRHEEARSFIARLNGRIGDDTPLRIKLDVSYAEEDLNRHSGDFSKAIQVHERRSVLEKNPAIACYERRAESDNRLAASLYDAHRFHESTGLLLPWSEELQRDEQICSPETRAILFNTLARSLVVLEDERWEQFFRDSLALQIATGGSVLRTTNYLIHSYFKVGSEDAIKHAEHMLLEIRASLLDSQSDPYLLWLEAEYDRRTGKTWDEARWRELALEESSHVYGFLHQAVARQQGQTSRARMTLLDRAKRSFGHGIENDATNVKCLLSNCCDLAIATTMRDEERLNEAIAEMNEFLERPELTGAKEWYDESLRDLASNHEWDAVDRLFARVPHL